MKIVKQGRLTNIGNLASNGDGREKMHVLMVTVGTGDDDDYEFVVDAKTAEKAAVHYNKPVVITIEVGSEES